MIHKILMTIVLGSSMLGTGANASNTTQKLSGTYQNKPSIIWFKSCPKDLGTTNKSFKCGELNTYIDYSNPKLGIIKLPIIMHMHQSDKKKYKGMLIMNFGGPWLENTVMLINIILLEEKSPQDQWLSQEVLDTYDIVTFDPRGIDHFNKDRRISCTLKDPKKQSEFNQITTKLNQMNRVYHSFEYYQLWNQRNELCDFAKNQSPPLYSYAFTRNTVKDMEVLRKLLMQGHKDKLINYYGGSYGTRLGLAYLMEYGKHIKLMILDGNARPDNNFKSMIKDSAENIEVVFKQIFTFCAESKEACPLYDPEHGLDSADNMISMYKNLRTNLLDSIFPPLAKDQLTADMLDQLLLSVVGGNPYDGLTGFMKALHKAIIDGDLKPLRSQYNESFGYSENKYSYNYNSAVTSAVTCQDYQQTKFLNNFVMWRSFMTQLNSEYPNFGYVQAYNVSSICIKPLAKNSLPTHPLLPGKPIKIHTNSQTKVLLLGNKYDPQTPLKWTHQVASVLGENHITHTMVQWNGTGHTTLFNIAPVGGCANKIVNGFLAADTLPNKQYVICNDGINPFLR